MAEVVEEVSSNNAEGELPLLSRRVFNKYDKDGSGSIDQEEFRNMCYDMGHYLTPEETEIAFLQIDS